LDRVLIGEQSGLLARKLKDGARERIFIFTHDLVKSTGLIAGNLTRLELDVLAKEWF